MYCTTTSSDLACSTRTVNDMSFHIPVNWVMTKTMTCRARMRLENTKQQGSLSLISRSRRNAKQESSHNPRQVVNVTCQILLSNFVNRNKWRQNSSQKVHSSNTEGDDPNRYSDLLLTSLLMIPLTQ